MVNNKTSVIYFHTGGGRAGDTPNSLISPSANLIDFILYLITQVDAGTIVYPNINTDKEVNLDIPSNCSLIEIPYFYNGGLTERLKFLFLYPVVLLKKTNRITIKEATYSISMGYDFFGSMSAIVRVYILRKNHSYIVRGNRPKTVATSSRSFLNKKYTLFRIKVYDLIMRRMVIKGQADIWFQGQEKYEEYIKYMPEQSRKRMHILNAVLRPLPKISREYEDKSDLLFMGHINIEKGIIDLLSALRLLKEKNIIPSLRIVGEGVEKESVRNLINEFGLREKVTFAGYASTTEQVSKELRSAKLFVLPSHTEGLPRAMIESMAIGTPVLVSNVGGIPFVVKDGNNGYLTKSKDPQLLAIKIKEVLGVLDENILKNEVIVNAKKTAESFNFSQRADVFLNQSIS